MQRSLTVRSFDPMLFTSPFFDNTRLSIIALADRPSSACNAHINSLASLETLPDIPAVAPDKTDRPKKQRSNRGTNHRLMYRERVRMQRCERFASGRTIEEDHDTQEDDVATTNISYKFKVHHTDTSVTTFEQLLTQSPSTARPHPYGDEHTVREEPMSCADATSTATLVISHRSANSSTGPKTRSVPSPSFRLGAIPRRLDRSLNSLHGSHTSMSSDASSTAIDTDRTVLKVATNALITTMSLVVLGVYSCWHLVFDQA